MGFNSGFKGLNRRLAEHQSRSENFKNCLSLVGIRTPLIQIGIDTLLRNVGKITNLSCETTLRRADLIT